MKNTPLLIKKCSHCDGDRFYCSDKFRMNAGSRCVDLYSVSASLHDQTEFCGRRGIFDRSLQEHLQCQSAACKKQCFCRCFIRILFNNSGAACINLCMDSREETGQISGSDFADQHGFAAVYCFARLYPAFRKKRSDHKRSVRTFAEPVWMLL